MKKVSVIALVVMGILFSAYAEAAKPGKRRSRNANRVGPYAGAMIGQTTFSNDQTETEQGLRDAFDEVNTQNLEITTDDSDISYQVAFGYRFMRYFAAELSLAQFGELSSTARADVNLGQGTQEARMKLSYTVAGPVFSAIGVLPFNDKFELYGRAGLLFASTERELNARVDGDPAGFGNARGDSTELVMGLGFAWHLSTMYTVRGEYLKVDGVGDEIRTGEEDFTSATLGLIVRF